MIVRTTPPSTRSAAPFVADASGLQTKTTRFATSSVVIIDFFERLRIEDTKII
jgi:hypothetical protein